MKKFAWIFAVGLVLAVTPLALQAADEGLEDDKPQPPRKGMKSPGGAGGPAGMGRGMGPRRRGRRKPITPEQEKQILEFTKEYMKHYHERLRKLLEENEQAYRRALSYLWPRVRRLWSMPPELRHAHLEERRLKVKIYQTAEAYLKATSPEEKEKQKQELQKLVARRFDVEQTILEHRLVELEDRLSRLKKQLAQRPEERNKIIEDRVKRSLTRRKSLPKPKGKAPSPPKDAPKDTSSKTEQPPKSEE